MRPFFTGLLALFLWLGGHSLQFSTALLVLFTALSFYFMLEESRRIFSPLVCVSLFLLLFLYYRGLAGSTLTENLGLAFGALGAGLLIQASRTKKLAWASAGIFMVSMALNTRPGPFFVLPFLVFWAAFYLRTDANRFWKAFFLTAGAGLLPFVFNSIMMRILSDTITIPFANFAYAIYGLVSDGNRYVQIFIDHPEVAQIQGNAHYLEIFRLTWSTFLSKPQNLFIGMFKNYCLFFSNSWYSMYGYVLSDHMLLTTIVRYALYVLSLLGVICGLRRTDKPVNKLVLAGFLGVLLSVPFVPPGDAHKVRLYAAALPLMILLPALGLQWCLDWTQWSWLYQPKDGKLPDRSSFRYSLFLVGLTLISPLIIALLSDAKAYQSSVCPQGQEAVIMRYDQGAFLRILREEEFFLDRMPDFHYGQYALSVHGLATQPEIAFFETIEPPAVISLGIDLNTGGELWFAANPDSMPAEDGVYGFCGRYEDKPYTFFYADQLVELSSVK